MAEAGFEGIGKYVTGRQNTVTQYIATQPILDHEETTWASGRGEMELYNLGHRGRTEDVSHGLPVQGRLSELPS